MSSPIPLSPTTRRAFDRMAGDCRRVFDSRLVALVATSPTSAVVFARTVEAADLEALGTLTEAWHHDGLATPLLLTPDEFRRSLDAFPLEYQAIADRHVVVAGTPPFEGIAVDAQHLRRACEVQAKGHLIHLRQGWMEAVGHDDQLAALVAESATPLRALLANVGRLHGSGGDDERSALGGARAASLDEALISEVLALEEHPLQARHLVRRLPDYLHASERLWAFVDGWMK